MCFGPEVAAAFAAAAPYIAATSAAVGTGATIYGASQSSAAQERQAAAIRQQNIDTTNAQNQAFTQRLAATTAQANAQADTGRRALADETTAALSMRAGQESALKRQNQTIQAENQTAEQIRAEADQRAQDLIAATSKPVLDQSQQGYQDQAAAILAAAQAPTPTGPQATDPSGSGASTSTNDPVVKTALARRMGIAAANIRQYGADIARVGSYGQPLQVTQRAVQDTQGGIMPAENAARLLQAGAGVRLLPSQVAYTGATDAGNANIGMIQQRVAAENQLSALNFGDTTSTANLGQSDADTRAANAARQAAADAQWQSQVGGLFAGLGNLGAYGAGRYFGFPSTTQPPLQGPSITGPPIG